MRSSLVYHITSLPALVDLESDPPLAPAELLARLAEQGKALTLIEAIFLHGDLMQREAVLSGEVEKPTAVVLSEEQVRDEAPLPEYLVEADDATDAEARPVAVDTLWRRYFTYLAQLAEKRKSRFLKEFVGFEVGLRNALATARAQALDLDPHDYRVADELDDGGHDYADTLSQWSSAADPLAGMEVLMRARWEWVAANEPWFQFSDDELAAYAAKLMMIDQYKRLAEARQASLVRP
jgi:vacuolar-type H+-ATPase subunit C/Vma6